MRSSYEVCFNWDSTVFCISYNVSGLAKAAQPHLNTFWGHARVELGPPGPSQWPQIKEGFRNIYNSGASGKFLDMTVAEATRNTLVAVEVACWFYIGEIIGRRSLVGYNVEEQSSH